ncbi:MAG: hypothetical protein U1G05_19270 [Kiritimatiellia bacterium]
MDNITDHRKDSTLGWKFWFWHSLPMFVCGNFLASNASFHFSVRAALVLIVIGSATCGMQSAYIKGLQQGTENSGKS